MIEKFTPEELEQIKAELALIGVRAYTAKHTAVAGSAAKEIFWKIFPPKIRGIWNGACRTPTTDILFKLTDAILGNYIIRERKVLRGDHDPCFFADNSLYQDQAKEYASVYAEIAQFLDRLWQEHATTREANIENAIKVWESNQNKEE